MSHLRVILEAKKVLFGMNRSSNFRVGGGSDYFKSTRQSADGVTVTHPAGAFFSHPLKKTFGLFDVELGESVFTLPDSHNGPTHRRDHEMHAVTNAQDRNSQVKNSNVGFRAVFFINAGRASGKDNPVGFERLNRLDGNGGRVNLTIHMVFPNPAGN